MLDGILLERKGAPSAVILTDQFVETGRAMAEAHGAGHFRWALTPHPISNRTPAELESAAGAVLGEVVSLLTDQA